MEPQRGKVQLMIDALVVISLVLAWTVPAWKFYFGPAYRGEFAHSSTCPCRKCVPQ